MDIGKERKIEKRIEIRKGRMIGKLVDIGKGGESRRGVEIGKGREDLRSSGKSGKRWRWEQEDDWEMERNSEKKR